MLGSLGDADDAVQEAWLHLQRADAPAVQNPSAWLYTVVGRVCVDMLRSRRARREEPWEEHLPEPIIDPPDAPTRLAFESLIPARPPARASDDTNDWAESSTSTNMPLGLHG